MSLVGQKRNYLKKFLFRAELPGVGYSGWTSVSAIEGEFANIQHWEGGSMTASNSPGRFTMSEITLTRGATSDKELWDLFKRTADLIENAGEMETDLLFDWDFVKMNRDGTEAGRLKMVESYCRKFGAGEWNNGADENVMESIVLVCRLFQPKN